MTLSRIREFTRKDPELNRKLVSLEESVFGLVDAIKSAADLETVPPVMKAGFIARPRQLVRVLKPVEVLLAPPTRSAAGRPLVIWNGSDAAITLRPTTGLLNGSVALFVGPAQLVLLFHDGSNWFAQFWGGPLSVTMLGAIGDGKTNNDAALARAVALGVDLYWPNGTYLTTQSIPGLHTVRHRGPGAIKRGSLTFYVEPKPGQTNRIYVATTGDNDNDGLSASQPRASIQGAFDAIGNYGPHLYGEWRIQVAAGLYTNQPVEVQGLTSASYIVIAGPNVAMNATPTASLDGTGSTSLFALMFSHNMMVLIQNIKVENWTTADASGVRALHRTQLWTYNVHVDSVNEGGISAESECRLYVQGGVITNCSKGIRAAQRTTFTIGYGGDLVVMQNCEYGAHLRNQSGGVVLNAEFRDCTVYGVQLLHSSEARFTDCLFEGNLVGLNITGSSWLDDGCTFSGNTRDIETTQHSGELLESFEYFYDHSNQRHAWGGGSSWFNPGCKYHFRYSDAGGIFHSGAHMGLEAANPVFSFLTDNVSATAFAGIYFARPSGTAIGQFVYRFDDDSIRITLGNTASYRLYSTDIRSNTDNSRALGTSAVRWSASHVVLRHWTATVFDSSGTGTPEGVVTAGIGSTFRRTDGGAGSSFYVKESGAGNTGWVAK